MPFINSSSSLTRRGFLSQLSVGAMALSANHSSSARASDAAKPDFAFFLIGDTHYLANLSKPNEMEAKSAAICGRLVDTLNRLPGTDIPAVAGGGQVSQIEGVIHAGDVIDTGDKHGVGQIEMQRTELARFKEDYGLTGRDGRLKFPVFELAGNHDSPHGEGLFIEQIKQRNKSRPGVVHVSDNGVHYSWDWGRTHFVNLGLIVGADANITRKRRYASLDSLPFLVADLQKHVGDSGRPVVLTHHVDIARYSVACNPQAPADSKEWDPCDVRAFHQAIHRYNVAGIFYGHTHARQVFQWDGLSTQAQAGIRVFNTDNASHFGGDTQAFFYVESHGGKLLLREFQTTDRWQTGFWTPKVWSL